MGRTLERLACEVIDANKYMTLATADADGRPWATPVYFTPVDYRELYWVSSPESRHSRNIAERPELSIVVFDSGAPIGGAQAVYMAARAEPVPDDELAVCARRFADRLPELTYFPPEQLRPPAPLRLYRARVTEHSVLIRGGDPEYGTDVYSRRVVAL